MKIAYIVSRYPALSETFIVREMEELTNHGWKPIICQLKWNSQRNSKAAMHVSKATILASQFNIIQWKLGWLWALRHKREELRNILKDLYGAGGNIFTRLKLLVILSTTLSIARNLDPLNISHIRAHFLHSEAVSANWLAKLINTPYSLTGHTTMIYFPRSLILKVVRDARFCFGTSYETVDLLENFRGTENGVYLIRNGVRLADFIPAAMDNNPNPPLILAVGRLIPKKGFDDLIQACAILRNKNDNWMCNIIGDGPEYSRLSHVIQQYDLENHVFLLGSLDIDQIIKLYSQAVFLVMPCVVRKDDVDGIPTVIIEALAAGLPVISTQVAAIPELIIHNETGLLSPPNNPTMLFEAIQQLLDNQDLGKRLGNAGRRKVQQEYDITKSVKQINALIRESIPS